MCVCVVFRLCGFLILSLRAQSIFYVTQSLEPVATRHRQNKTTWRAAASNKTTTVRRRGLIAPMRHAGDGANVDRDRRHYSGSNGTIISVCQALRQSARDIYPFQAVKQSARDIYPYTRLQMTGLSTLRSNAGAARLISSPPEAVDNPDVYINTSYSFVRPPAR